MQCLLCTFYPKFSHKVENLLKCTHTLFLADGYRREKLLWRNPTSVLLDSEILRTYLELSDMHCQVRKKARVDMALSNFTTESLCRYSNFLVLHFSFFSLTDHPVNFSSSAIILISSQTPLYLHLSSPTQPGTLHT